MEYFIYLTYMFVGLCGLCVGSFVNVFIDRVTRGISPIKGRLACPAYGAQIKAQDRIPLLSYALCKGRCRMCAEKISPRYLLIELLCGLLAVLTYIQYDLSPVFVFVFLLGALFAAVAAVDLDTMRIPNAFVAAFIPFAIASALFFPQIGFAARVIGFFCVSLPMLALALIIPGGFGGGDIKLMAVCGFLLGWKLTLTAMCIAVMTGGLAALLLLVSGRVKARSHIPFGPALCLGCFIALLWGDTILGWYLVRF